jgi:hypothetical protein
MGTQSDAEKKAAAFDALTATLETLGPRGTWEDSPEKARDAAAKLLGALRDALAAGGSSVESQFPVLEVLAALGGLQQGHKSWLTDGLAARSRRPPEDVARIAHTALACATVDILHKGGKELEDATREVAVGARLTATYLRQWRKDLTSGRKSPPARQMYDDALEAVRRGHAQEVATMNGKGVTIPPDFARGYYRERGNRFLELLRRKGHAKPPHEN